MASIELPKPAFSTSDETSLSLACKFPSSDHALQIISENLLRLQYKQPHELWEQAKLVALALDKPSEKKGATVDVTVSSSVCVEDLNPGTPYAVRFIVVNANEEIIQVGPDTVFDTAPVDCGPKKKSCSLS
jgi:hypothetical protein